MVVDIAVTGESGAGKSSFINAICGMEADDEGAAEVGVTETTTEPTKYCHPTDSSVTFWDLPGVGTPRFPKDSYLEKIRWKRFHCVIVISSGRFRENDLWLVKRFKSIDKIVFFVRCKIDQDIESEQRRRRRQSDDTMQRILQDCENNLMHINNVPVFLISNVDTALYDFPSLEDRLVRNITDIKTDVKKQEEELRQRTQRKNEENNSCILL